MRHQVHVELAHGPAPGAAGGATRVRQVEDELVRPRLVTEISHDEEPKRSQTRLHQRAVAHHEVGRVLERGGLVPTLHGQQLLDAEMVELDGVVRLGFEQAKLAAPGGLEQVAEVRAAPQALVPTHLHLGRLLQAQPDLLVLAVDVGIGERARRLLRRLLDQSRSDELIDGELRDIAAHAPRLRHRVEVLAEQIRHERPIPQSRLVLGDVFLGEGGQVAANVADDGRGGGGVDARDLEVAEAELLDELVAGQQRPRLGTLLHAIQRQGLGIAHRPGQLHVAGHMLNAKDEVVLAARLLV
mmetsp:Transcript_95618/g.275526  ORF Transcript_95618/g.275526 Transcript_95618/m.275526 type:complete len:299 (-) Transcript_95618:908-1804(-)